ncbi:MAG: LamG domain-containing protein, partial [Acidobacteria bacterium]|nr:LamG domain-containing protein [Acidobacteriota bacterium]
MGRKRAATSLLGPILLVGVLAPLFIPTPLAYLEQPFSGTAANSGSIRLLFHLDESSGTAATDASKYANTGTLTNFPASPWSGTALNFDGVDDFVSVASAANLDLTTSLSLEAWVNITTNSPVNPLTIVSKWDETNGRRAYLLQLGTNRKVQFLLSSDGTGNPGSLFTAASAAALTINTWYHVSATYDGTTMQILINGVQDGTLAGPASVFVSPALLRVGARGNAASAAEDFFQGAMDEPRVLDYARTDYSQLHIYHFNESGTTPPGDAGGYNHAATLVSAPTYTSMGARFGNGLSVNGTTQYSDSLYIGPDENSAALSLEAWIQPSVVTGTRTILTSETVGSTRMKLGLSGANVQFLLKTGSTTTLTSAGTVSA